MFRWLYHVESSAEYIPFQASVTYLPAIPYMILCGVILGLFLGILNRLADQFSPR
jgi:hypothetical protein